MFPMGGSRPGKTILLSCHYFLFVFIFRVLKEKKQVNLLRMKIKYPLWSTCWGFSHYLITSVRETHSPFFKGNFTEKENNQKLLIPPVSCLEQTAARGPCWVEKGSRKKHSQRDTGWGFLRRGSFFFYLVILQIKESATLQKRQNMYYIVRCG